MNAGILNLPSSAFTSSSLRSKPAAPFFGQTTMSQTASHTASAQSTESFTVPVPRTKFVAFLTAIGAIVLITSEIWLAAVAALWAAGGVFGFGMTGDIILIALIIPPALWGTWMTVKLAIAAELDPENAD
ncbi:hypothetical protein [Hoeflea sp.]